MDTVFYHGTAIPGLDTIKAKRKISRNRHAGGILH